MQFQEDGDSSDNIFIFICYSKPVMIIYLVVFLPSWDFSLTSFLESIVRYLISVMI